MTDYTPFIDIRLHIAPVGVLGNGVFAKESIKAQTFIEIAPVVVFSPESPVDDELMKYVVAWDDRLAVGLGWTMMYNHSDENNCAFSTNHSQRLLAIVTLRDVEAGEQLTVDYGPNWFSSRLMDKVKI